MTAQKRIVLGTRGSDLARAQSALVSEALGRIFPGIELSVRVIKTAGDEKSGARMVVTDRQAGRKGMFTAEIERALLEHEIDVAVHSAKDLPSVATAGTNVCAALPRASVEDVMVATTAGDLRSLPRGATVATGSVRRQHQLLWARPDLQIADLRGNVPTRLRKLTASAWDAIILARAGLERLGFDCGAGELSFEGNALRVAILPVDTFLPAGGQGIVALQIRGDDLAVREIVNAVNHLPTLLCLRAEREFLRLLDGDCGTAVGVIATAEAGFLALRAQLFEPGRAEPRAAALQQSDSRDTPESLAARLLDLING